MLKKEFQLNQSLKLLAKSSFIVFIGVILSKILGYAYRIIVARYYGPEAYGLFVLSLGILGWFTLASHLGLGTGIVRYFSFYIGKKDKKKVAYIFRFFSRFLLITGVISGVLLFFLSDIISEKIFSNLQLSPFLKLLSLTLPLVGLKGIFYGLMQSYEKIGWYSFISNVLDTFVKVIVLIILTFIGINLFNLPVSYLFASIITFLFSYLFCRISFKKIFRIKPKKDKKLIKKIISYSWPLIFFAFSMVLLTQVDSFMIGFFKTAKEVGFYNAAVPIALLLTFSIDLFGYLFFPIVTKEYAKENKEIVKQLSQQTGKWVYMISLPLFVLFIVFPGVFIKLLFGEEYLVAVNSLRFLSIGAMFTAVFEISKKLILIKGKSKLLFKDTLFILFLNIVLNLILIPKYGITGAAIATMVSYVSLGSLLAFQSWKYLGIVPLRRKMINITIVALIPTGFLLLIKQIIEINLFTLIVLGILFISLYVLLILLTGCLDKNDKLILNLIKEKLFLNKKSKQVVLNTEREDL
ncbi:MAG: flippase [Nanoarchaeota archaeon]|nr:flippase [Nanoarchaeota archaeon]